MYHAQEKIVNTPGSPITGQRGGIHNSVTRVITKPTRPDLSSFVYPPYTEKAWKLARRLF